jgi:hypothetical protein
MPRRDRVVWRNNLGWRCGNIVANVLLKIAVLLIVLGTLFVGMASLGTGARAGRIVEDLHRLGTEAERFFLKYGSTPTSLEELSHAVSAMGGARYGMVTDGGGFLRGFWADLAHVPKEVRKKLAGWAREGDLYGDAAFSVPYNGTMEELFVPFFGKTMLASENGSAAMEPLLFQGRAVWPDLFWGGRDALPPLVIRKEVGGVLSVFNPVGSGMAKSSGGRPLFFWRDPGTGGWPANYEVVVRATLQGSGSLGLYYRLKGDFMPERFGEGYVLVFDPGRRGIVDASESTQVPSKMRDSLGYLLVRKLHRGKEDGGGTGVFRAVPLGQLVSRIPGFRGWGTHEISLRVSGRQHTILVDGVRVLDFLDDHSLEGGAALRIAPASRVVLEDVRVLPVR